MFPVYDRFINLKGIIMLELEVKRAGDLSEVLKIEVYFVNSNEFFIGKPSPIVAASISPSWYGKLAVWDGCPPPNARTGLLLHPLLSGVATSTLRGVIEDLGVGPTIVHVPTQGSDNSCRSDMAKVRATFKISDNTVLCRSYTDEVDWSDVPDHHNACSAVFIKNGRCTSWETTFFNTGEISPTCQTLYIPSFTASLAANVKTPGSYTVFKNDPDIELVSLVSSDIDWTNIYPMFTSCEVQLKEDPESSGILLLSTTFFEDSAEGGWSLDVGSFNASVKKVLTSPGTYTLKRVTQP